MLLSEFLFNMFLFIVQVLIILLISDMVVWSSEKYAMEEYLQSGYVCCCFQMVSVQNLCIYPLSKVSSQATFISKTSFLAFLQQLIQIISFVMVMCNSQVFVKIKFRLATNRCRKKYESPKLPYASNKRKVRHFLQTWF